MRLKQLLVYTLFLLPLSAFGTTTVTGHVSTLGTTAVTSSTFVRFWLRGCGGNQPRINGTSIIAPSQGGTYYIDFPVNASGNVSGSLYSTRDGAGTGNGDIECGGSQTSVWYGMVVFNSGKAGPETPIHAKSGGTIDVSNVTPITTSPVVNSPTGDTTYARLDGGNQPFTGAIQAPKVNSVFYVGSVYATITAAAAACPAYTGAAGNSCTIVVPSTIACGEPSQLADNIVLIDYRNCSQSQGLRFNLSAAVTGNVRSKMFLQDNYDAGTIGLNPSKSAATAYFNLYVDHPEQTSGTIEAINGTANVNSYSADMASGHIIGIEGSAQATVSGTAHNIADLRGGTFNTTIGGNTTVTQMTSLYAQTPVLLSAATATRQYAFVAEDVSGSSSSDDASIWAKGRTRVDGPLSIRGNTFLPAATATNLWCAGAYGAPTLGRCFVGDGTGWQFSFSKRTGSVNTDLWTFKDSGILTGPLGNATQTAATGTATVDLASVASAACTADSSDVTLTGAAVGDPVRVTAATALPAGVWLIGRVTASNTGRFQLCNLSGGAVDRASDTYTISVVK